MIIINGKRWFDKVNGNTYHNVSVNVDGVEIGKSGIHYGYGDQYIQTAHAMLQDAGIFPKTGERLKSGMDKDYNDFLTDRMNNREKYYITVSDVSRKRDL
jgi:hypothetical protein